MKSLAVRVTLVALFVVATGVAAYVVWMDETRAAARLGSTRAFDSAAMDAERTALDLRASQQAYVAAGQGEQFWISDAAARLASLKTALEALRGQATAPAAQSALDNVAAALQDFEQMDRRARDYARNGQKLMASDLIFADGLEMTRAIAASIEEARTAELMARDREGTIAHRAGLAAVGAAAIIGLGTIPLLLRRPVTQTAVTVPASDAHVEEPAGAHALHARPPIRTAAPDAPASSLDFGAVATLCSDLARVVDTQALPGILARAASVLDAPGIVLWIADPDGRELSPILTHGYPQQIVSRLGTIPHDAENATAAAFRTALLQTVDADSASNGAIAAPLVTPGGCVGVMAAEVRRGSERDAAKLAAASIVAAQLATLVGPPSRAQAKAEAAGL